MIKHSSPEPLRPFAWEEGVVGRTQQEFFLFSCFLLCCLHSLGRPYWAATVCVRERERDRACVLWRRPISLGPVFVVIGGAADPILCLLPLDIS